MSIPQRIYELGRSVAHCDVVKTKTATEENMRELQNILNDSVPVNHDEEVQHSLIRGMYYCNPVGFLQYVSNPANRVMSLVLWTESKRIARFYKLNGVVHISWNADAGSYIVVPYIPREERDSVPSPDEVLADDPDHDERNTRPSRRGTRGSSRGSRPMRGARGSSRGGSTASTRRTANYSADQFDPEPSSDVTVVGGPVVMTMENFQAFAEAAAEM